MTLKRKIDNFNLDKYPSGIKPVERKNIKKLSEKISDAINEFSMSFFDDIKARNNWYFDLRKINGNFRSWVRNADGLVYEKDLKLVHKEVKDAHAKFAKKAGAAYSKIAKAAKAVVAAIDAVLKELAKLKQHKSAELRPYISYLLEFKKEAKVFT